MLQGIAPPQIAGRGYIFSAAAVGITPSLYSTAAGMSGPILWNGSAVTGLKGVTAYLLSISYGLAVASTAAGALGLTGGSAQPAAPTSTTAITKAGCLTLGGPTPQCTPYNVGTVVTAGGFWLPVGHVHTGAITLDTADENFIHLGGAIVVPINTWAGAASDAILSASNIDVCITWMEVPN